MEELNFQLKYKICKVVVDERTIIHDLCFDLHKVDVDDATYMLMGSGVFLCFGDKDNPDFCPVGEDTSGSIELAKRYSRSRRKARMG